MRLDPTYLKFITKDEMRVLLSVEMGMKNHQYVPRQLIERISHLKRASAYMNLKLLLKNKLVVHDGKKYDGYKLTYLGYDYLALHVFMKRGTVAKVHCKIGVGKESDIYSCESADGELCVLKLARLGRTSFRTIKNNRDYIKHRTQLNWLYLSRLASCKEYAFMEILHKNNFPTPIPKDWNRHGIVMSLIDGYPMGNVKELEGPEPVFDQLMDLIKRLAEFGLIHSDFNEFNLMIDHNKKITMIDFPQMVSTKHFNSRFYFERDVNCIHTFFERRFKFVSTYTLDFKNIERKVDLDNEVKASGFVKKGLGEQNVEDLAILDDYENLVKNLGQHESEDDNNYEEDEGEEREEEGSGEGECEDEGEEDLQDLEEGKHEDEKTDDPLQKEEIKNLENDLKDLSDIEGQDQSDDDSSESEETEEQKQLNEEQLKLKADKAERKRKNKERKAQEKKDIIEKATKQALKQQNKKTFQKYRLRQKKKNHDCNIVVSDYM